MQAGGGAKGEGEGQADSLLSRSPMQGSSQDPEIMTRAEGSCLTSFPEESC